MLDIKKRPLSWSSLSSFEYDKIKWAKKYIDGEEEPPTKEMLFGNTVGGRISSDPLFLPEVPRYEIFEKKLIGKIGDIKLIGFLDSFQKDPMAILEYKTSSSEKRWNQSSAEEHRQILFYLGLLWLNYGVQPELIKCDLVYIPVEEKGDFSMGLAKKSVQIFNIKHTTMEVLNFLNYVKKVHAEMIKYAEEYVKLQN